MDAVLNCIIVIAVYRLKIGFSFFGAHIITQVNVSGRVHAPWCFIVAGTNLDDTDMCDDSFSMCEDLLSEGDCMPNSDTESTVSEMSGN